MPWLYGSFLLVGLAAGSKYNAGALVLTPIIIYLISVLSSKTKNMKTILLNLGLGGLISFLGYFVGNPGLIKDPIQYILDLSQVLKLHATYNILPGDIPGLWGQWYVLFSQTVGEIFSILLLIAIIYTVIRLILHKKGSWGWDTIKSDSLLVILISMATFDLPIMISYNYQSRFFLFFIPMFALILAVFWRELSQFLRPYKMLSFLFLLSISGAFIFSFLESASIFLKFNNDSRIIASDYVAELPSSNKIEYTLYPPRINDERFLSSFNYPISLVKFPDQELPTSPLYEFNTGEIGIEKRQPDIIIIDSLTVDRFDNAYVCELHQLDCAFFKKLENGKTNYRLIKSFIYDLPTFLPEVNVSFTNPDIFVYQRIP